MKTINNVQKATLRSAAVIASLVLISLTVSAQDFWRELLTKNSFGEIAEAMINSTHIDHSIKVTPVTSSTAWFSENMEEAAESSLEMEDWMVSTDHFNTSKSVRNFQLEEATDKELQLEGWMLDCGLWK